MFSLRLLTVEDKHDIERPTFTERGYLWRQVISCKLTVGKEDKRAPHSEIKCLGCPLVADCSLAHKPRPLHVRVVSVTLTTVVFVQV